MLRRSRNELIRVPGAAIPGVLAPTIFFLGLTAVFGGADAAAGLRHQQLLELPDPGQPAAGGRLHRRRDGRQPRARHRERALRPLPRLPRPALGAARRAGRLCQPALARPGDVPVRRRDDRRRPLSRRPRPVRRDRLRDGDGRRRRLLGLRDRAQVQDPVGVSADAGRDARRDPDDDRLRPPAPAHRLDVRPSPSTTRSPRSSKPSARASSAASPGRGRGPGWSSSSG